VRRETHPMVKAPVVWVSTACLCLALAGVAAATPFMFGSQEEETRRYQEEAEKIIMNLGFEMDLSGDDIVLIGSGYAVDGDETVEGDVVIIGGGLTVEGTIEGDAVVIGGSMYLSSTSTVEGDAAVIGGILEREEGSTVIGDILENPETAYTSLRMEDLEEIEEIEDIEEVASHEGDVVKFAKDIHIEEGEVIEGSVVAIGGDIRIDGMVTEEVVTTGGDITVGSTAQVLGDVVATFGEITVEPGAMTEGDVVEISLGGAHIVAAPQGKAKAYFGIPSAQTTTYIVSLNRPDADEVRLTGTFVDWDTDGIEMKRDDEGTWMTTVSLEPGEYMYKFIVDGKWIPDPDVEERVSDGKGGWATPIVVKPKIKMKHKVDADTKIIFKLHRPEAHDVRVSGTFNDWDPEGIPLAKSSKGTWSVTVPIPPGSYLYRFYIDGEWVPDPDVDRKMEDGKGGWATPFYVKPADEDYVTIRFSYHRPDASDVRVTGCFNDWDPEGIRMGKDEDGTWVVMVPLLPGKYQYKFYIDGKWGPDPDVDETVPDGKGGYATEFKVKRPAEKKRRTRADILVGMDDFEPKGTAFTPVIDYNRVDGLYYGAVLQNKTNCFPLPRFYVEGGHSIKRERFVYMFELEQPVFDPAGLSIGGSIYDKTDTYDKELIGDVENLLAAAFLRKDYKDYFGRSGVTGFAAIRPNEQHTLKAAYSDDEYEPLPTKAKSTLIWWKDGEFPDNPQSSYQICYNPVTGKETCEEIKVTSLAASYEFDSRDSKKAPSAGFWVRLISEWASQDWGGDLEYTRYTADLRQYHKLAPRQKIALRLKAGLMDLSDVCACSDLPGAEHFFPKEFYAGGIGTVPGYNYKQFRGTHMVLANLEYAINLDKSFSVVFFTDGGDAAIGLPTKTGSVWDRWENLRMKFDAGVGVRHEDPGDHVFTLSIARGLTDLRQEPDEDRPVIVTVRASRMF
jgi:hypothetical protein